MNFEKFLLRSLSADPYRNTRSKLCNRSDTSTAEEAAASVQTFSVQSNDMEACRHAEEITSVSTESGLRDYGATRQKRAHLLALDALGSETIRMTGHAAHFRLARRLLEWHEARRADRPATHRAHEALLVVVLRLVLELARPCHSQSSDAVHFHHLCEHTHYCAFMMQSNRKRILLVELEC